MHIMDKDLCFIFLFYKHTYTCGNDDDDDSSRQLLLKSGAYKYLIARNVRHTHSLLVPDEQSMLRFFSSHSLNVNKKFLFRHTTGKNLS